MKYFLILFLFPFQVSGQKGERIERVITYELTWVKDTRHPHRTLKEYFAPL